MSYLYSFSDKLYPTWWWPQQHWPKHVVDKLYTPDNIVVLWLLYPYRIITLVSNKHNGDDAPWNSLFHFSTFNKLVKLYGVPVSGRYWSFVGRKLKKGVVGYLKACLLCQRDFRSSFLYPEDGSRKLLRIVINIYQTAWKIILIKIAGLLWNCNGEPPGVRFHIAVWCVSLFW